MDIVIVRITSNSDSTDDKWYAWREQTQNLLRGKCSDSL